MQTPIPLPGLSARNANMPAAWERIVAWSHQHFPPLAAGLAPGLTEQAIRDAEKDAGVTFSDDLRSLYQCADGEIPDGIGLFFGLRFLTLNETIDSWRFWNDLIEAEADLADETDGHSSTPDGAIDARYYNPGWIAFADDFGGNHLGIDCAPGPTGVSGQVINFGRDEYDKRVLARDLASFLEWIADSLEAGNFRIIDHRDEPGGSYEFVLAKPENHHFLDALRQM